MPDEVIVTVTATAVDRNGIPVLRHVPTPEQAKYEKVKRRYRSNGLDFAAEQRQATRTMTRALKLAGCIKRPKCCDRCHAKAKNKALTAHHTDYSDARAIVWLCRQCHDAIERVLRA